VVSNKVISFLEGKTTNMRIAPSNFIMLGGDFDFTLIEELHEGQKKGMLVDGNVVRIYMRELSDEYAEVRDQ
jgi:hypothetical protein